MRDRFRNRANDYSVDWAKALQLDPREKKCPSDIDGIIERNGKFLVLEWKTNGKAPDLGQRILLDRLAGLPDFIVFVIWGTAHPSWRIEQVQRIGQHAMPVVTSTAEFVAWYHRWLDYAEKSVDTRRKAS